MNDNQQAVILEPPGQHTASIIWLHGLGADGYDFEPVVPALRLPAGHGIRFIFPHAPERPVTINGGMVMRAWYDVRMVDLRKHEDQAGIESSSQILEQFISVEKQAGIPAGRIILAGFSQGGVIALHTGLRYPESLAGIMALSTYLALPETLSREVSTANRQTAIFMAHGTQDPVIPIQQGRHSAEQLIAAGYHVDWHEYPMQHAVSLEEITAISHWIQTHLIERSE